MPNRCALMLAGDGAEQQCQRRAGYGPQGAYCKSCTRVWWPEMDVGYELEALPRAEQKETPWAKKVLGIFTPWRTRKEWPVGSVLLRRNNNGLFRHRFRDDLIKCGLGTGTGDWIGFKSINITQEMVGQRFAQFASVEAKRDGKGFEEWQQKWHDMLLENGALSFRLAPETKDAVMEILNK